MELINENIYFIGLFLLILLVTGNYIAETFGCTIQKLFYKNQYIKHIALIFLIYFTVNLNIFDFENYKNYNKVLSTIIIWVLFILFTKSTLIFTIIDFILITIIYVAYYKKYNLTKNNKNKNKITNLFSHTNNLTNFDNNNENINYENNTKTDINIKNDLKKLNIFINSLSILLTIFLILGFYNYLMQQKSIFKKKFNIITFIFGKSNCNSLK